MVEVVCINRRVSSEGREWGWGSWVRGSESPPHELGLGERCKLPPPAGSIVFVWRCCQIPFMSRDAVLIVTCTCTRVVLQYKFQVLVLALELLVLVDVLASCGTCWPLVRSTFVEVMIKIQVYCIF